MKAVNYFFVCCAVLGICWAMGCGQQEAATQQGQNEGIPEILPMEFSILVNYGDSSELISNLPYSSEMTVYEAMEVAREMGGLAFTDSTFSGIGKFVSGINGIRQQPTNKRYWQICVDGISAIEGVETLKLEAGQEIQWYLGEETPCKGFGE